MRVAADIPFPHEHRCLVLSLPCGALEGWCCGGWMSALQQVVARCEFGVNHLFAERKTYSEVNRRFCGFPPSPGTRPSLSSLLLWKKMAFQKPDVFTTVSKTEVLCFSFHLFRFHWLRLLQRWAGHLDCRVSDAGGGSGQGRQHLCRPCSLPMDSPGRHTTVLLQASCSGTWGGQEGCKRGQELGRFLPKQQEYPHPHEPSSSSRECPANAGSTQ